MLCFDSECCHVSRTWDTNHSKRFEIKMMEFLLEALPARKDGQVKELSLRNFENFDHGGIAAREEFVKILRGLQSLRLNIVNKDVRRRMENDYRV